MEEGQAKRLITNFFFFFHIAWGDTRVDDEEVGRYTILLLLLIYINIYLY